MKAEEDWGAILATNDDPTPATVSPEFDDIDGRAAQLMAQIAARRQQVQQEPDPEPVDDEPDDDEPSLSADDGEPDLRPPDSDEFGLAPVQYAEPQDTESQYVESDSVSFDPVVEQAPAPIDDVDEVEQHHATAPAPPAVPDDETPRLGGKHRSPRRMASPPWQASASPAVRAEDPVPEFNAPDAEPTVPEVGGEAPQTANGQQPSILPPPPPGWHPGMPLPAPVWQEPPPGWPPALPPLPPGWQGPPPPWMPPPGQDRAAYPPPDQTSVPQPEHNGADSNSGFFHQNPPPRFRPDDFSFTQTFSGPPSLDEAEVLSREQITPQSGWRRAVHKVSGGRINPGMSRKEGELQDLLEQIRQPIVGDFRIAVLSIKGGVGKTTTTLGLGSALAMARADRVVAVDANPDRGTLAERVLDTSTSSTVRDLLRDPNIRGYADVRLHTRLASSRLEVLASEQDPAVAEVFGETDYRRTMDILRNYYNVILTDCGTGIMHSAMAGVLDLAHAIVLVSSPAIDAARSASATLDWLEQHDHGDLVREAHVVLSVSHPGSPTLKLEKVFDHFDARCGSIHMIPFEPHLAEGADFDFNLLSPATTQAYLELAGAVAGKFSRPRRR